MDIYRLDVIEVPTNMPVVRDGRGRRGLPHGGREIQGDHRTSSRTASARGQPVLVGTTSIEKSEILAEHAQEGIRHPAQRPQRPLSRAGGPDHRPGRRPGAVTIATNMAGRGTDIQLGGNAEMRIATELGEVSSAGPSATGARLRSRPRSSATRRR